MERDKKIDEPLEVARAPRARWRTIVRRVLKYGFLASLLGAICLACVNWNKNSWYEIIELDVAKNHAILLKAERNEFTMGLFKKDGKYPPDRGHHESVFLWGHCRHYTNPKHPPGEPNTLLLGGLMNRDKGIESAIGFGTVAEIKLESSHPIPGPVRDMMADTHYYQTEVTYTGIGVMLRRRMLLLLLGTAFMLVFIGGRFSLRMFLIWVTIVCVILALEVRSDSESKAELKKFLGRHGT